MILSSELKNHSKTQEPRMLRRLLSKFRTKTEDILGKHGRSFTYGFLVAAALVGVSCSKSSVEKANIQDTYISDSVSFEANSKDSMNPVTKDSGVKDSSETKDTGIKDLNISDILKPETSPKDSKVEVKDVGVGDGPNPDLFYDVAEIKDITYVDTPLDYGYEVEVSKDLQSDEVSAPPVKCWGQNLSSYPHHLQDVIQTKDGGYALTGATLGSIGGDIWVVKLNNKGNMEWEKFFGSMNEDVSYSIEQTQDGGYVVAGGFNFTANISDQRAWILKLNASGDLEWDKLFYEFGSRATSAHQTYDGGYIACGDTALEDSTYQYPFVLKLFSNGDQEWDKIYTDSSYCFSVKPTMDNGYIFGISVNSSWIMRLVKLNSDGSIGFDKSYEETAYHGAPYDVMQTLDGGYITVGSNGDLLVFKVDISGNLEWYKTFGDGKTILDGYSDNYSWDVGFSIDQTNDAGYIVSGSTGLNGNGKNDGWVINLDINGDLMWDKTLGWNDTDGLYGIKQTLDGGYITTGLLQFPVSPSNKFVLKLDANGNLENCE